MNDKLTQLQEALNILRRAEGTLRLGQVIYTNRHIGYLFPIFDGDEEKTNAVRRIRGRLRKGEQLDADDEIKSLFDKVANDIRKINVSAGPRENSPDAQSPS